MSYEDPTLCHCSCHTHPEVMHCVPCCISCDICGAHVHQFTMKTHHMNQHKEKPLEKYGVELDKEKVKTADGSGLLNCPKCAMPLSKEESAAHHCPTCGTEPWEKKPDNG